MISPAHAIEVTGKGFFLLANGSFLLWYIVAKMALLLTGP